MDVYWTVNRWCIHKPILSRHGRIHSFQLSELQALYNKVHGGKNGKTLDNVFAYVTKCFDFVTSRIFPLAGMDFFHSFAPISKNKKMKAIKRMFALPIVAMLLVGGFSACSQDDDLFEYDLRNDEVATLAKRSMPRNGESIVPSGQRDEVSVTFVPEDPNYGSMTVSVSYSYKNHSLFTNKEFDNAIKTASKTIDQNIRMRELHKAEKILIEDEAVIIPIAYFEPAVLKNPRLKDVFYIPFAQYKFSYSYLEK